MVTAELQLTRQELDALSNFQIRLSEKFEGDDGIRQATYSIVNNLAKMIEMAKKIRETKELDVRRNSISDGLSARNDALKMTRILLKKLDDMLDIGVQELEKVQHVDHLVRINLQSVVLHNLPELKTIAQNVQNVLIKGFLMTDSAMNSFITAKESLFTETNNTSAIIRAARQVLAEIRKTA